VHDARKVAVFYEFMSIADPLAEKYWVESMCLSHDILGTVVIAHEGINAALLGDEANLDAAIADFEEKFCALAVGWSAIQEDKRPFDRMRVKVRDEIVTSGEVAKLSNRLGDYVEVARWHELMDDPAVAVVDVRNRHETEVGTFPGAIDPSIRAFRDFPGFVSECLDPGINKRIAMFCTGGIRCEKASAFMLENGFEEVYQLKGGILGYLGEVSFRENRWAGDCFVFDQRISIDQALMRTELVRPPRLPR
jgi:UPF0176 protein